MFLPFFLLFRFPLLYLLNFLASKSMLLDTVNPPSLIFLKIGVMGLLPSRFLLPLTFPVSSVFCFVWLVFFAFLGFTHCGSQTNFKPLTGHAITKLKNLLAIARKEYKMAAALK